MHYPLRQFLSMSMLGALLVGCEVGLPEGDWDNPHDPNGTAYFPPLVGLRDTSIRDPDTGIVQSFARGQVAAVESCRWTLDEVALDTRDCSIPVKGWADGNHVVTVSATDGRGVVGAIATANVWIGNLPPRLDPIADQRIPATDAFQIALSAKDPDGSILEIAWDTVPDRYAIRGDLVSRPALGFGGSETIHWRAVDDEGATTTSRFSLGRVAAPEVVLEVDPLTADLFGGHLLNPDLILKGWTVRMDSGAVFRTLVAAEVPGFPDEPVTVTVTRQWNEPLTCTQADPAARMLISRRSPTHRCTELAVSSWSYATFVATATNRFGAVAKAEIGVDRQWWIVIR